jgi:hypothetical protein
MLSVLIATYNMQRELPRTLLSALPSLQRQVSGFEYEIIVVDNGSPVPLELGGFAERLARAQVRLIRIDPAVARPSPVFCINEAALRHARGDKLLICIDGARMFSSHLVRRTIDLLNRYDNAVTFVGSRHLGPKVQSLSVQEGYCQAQEDILLDSVDWNHDVDLLFDYSVWAGAHGKHGAFLQNESNAIGISKKNWIRFGGYNEGFTRPGGGLCNLELFNRLRADPALMCVSLLGEATFHQVHGGAATSNIGYFSESLDEHRVAASRDYEFEPGRVLFDIGQDIGRADFAKRICLA